jgi:hypothetical protein
VWIVTVSLTGEFFLCAWTYISTGIGCCCISPCERRQIESRSGEVYSIQHYVIKFVSDLRQVGRFSLCTPVSSTNKTDCHNITEILLKVALNTITLTQPYRPISLIVL